MKKLLLSGVTALVCVAAALAETDYVAMPIIQDIQKGANTKNQIQNLRVLETATVGGTLAVAGNSTLGGALDVDSVTVDAGAGVDTATAGTLKLGETTANKVELSVAGVETEVQGTLDVIQAADFDAAVTVAGDINANGNIVGDASTVVTNVATVFAASLRASGNLVLGAGTSLSVEGTAAGMTTNVTITTASGTITNYFVFTDGVLTGYSTAP